MPQIYLGSNRELAIGKAVQFIREGEWDHPEYGTFAVTEADIDNMIKNFDANVTKQDSPIDIDHDHSRGAVGWLQRVFKSTDEQGRAILKGIVDWTEDGVKQVGTAFRHTSIHYDPDYQDAESGQAYGPTIRSASITNFPFVKDMEPISLSEFKSYKEDTVADDKKEEVVLSAEETKQVKGILPRLLSILNSKDEPKSEPDPKPEPEPAPDPAPGEPEPALAVALTEAKAEQVKLREQSEKMSKELAEIKAARQTDKFVALMEQNRWVGDRSQSISILRLLSETKGEDSEEFKAYVAEQNAHSKQIFESKLFDEAGSNQVITQDEGMLAEVAKIREGLALKDDAAGNAQALTEYYRRNPKAYAAAQKLTEAK